jgi:hypothetical protein
MSNTIAYVLNVHTGESTRYTNQPFMHIIHLGGKAYGVKSDGLYLLEGTTDSGTAISGVLTTKDTDFGSFQSKRLEMVYLNSDTATTITPYYDGIATPVVTSGFGGRRTKMAKGANGRYIQLKIADIVKLQGAELLPQELQRRVK